jgi:small redox-active disulfide protein 2
MTVKIEILGKGCPKCMKLEEMTRKTAEKLGLKVEIGHVKDVDKILDYGVMMTPALVVDGVVKISGRLPSEKELETALGEK